MDTEHIKQVHECAEYIISKAGKCDIALVLGSGLGGFAEHNFGSDKIEIPYEEIKGMPKTSVVGHKGALIIGMIGGKKVLCFSGRFHSYEGHDIHILTFIPRLAYECGCKIYFVTNAAGGIIPGIKPGSGVIITDNFSMVKWNPLSTLCYHPETPGPMKGKLYSERLAELAENIARSESFINETSFNLKGEDRHFELHRAPYAMFSGPSYETPAEVRFAHKIGIGAVGMSTVPEAIAAHQCGMEVFGLSVVTNVGAGFSDVEEVLSHEDVKLVAGACSAAVEKLFLLMIERSKLPETVPPTENPYKDSDDLAHYEPKPLHISPVTRLTEEELDQITDYVKEKLGIKGKIASLIYPPYSIINRIDGNKIMLRDVPNAAKTIQSIIGMKIELVYNPKHNSLFVFYPNDPVGLNVPECSLLAGIAVRLGVHCGIVFYNIAKFRSVDGSKLSNIVFTYDNTFNWTVNTPIPAAQPLENPLILINNEKKILTTTQLVLDDKFEYKSVAFFTGPGFPSDFQLQFAEKLGAAYVTYESFAPMVGLRMHGVPTVALAATPSMLDDKCILGQISEAAIDAHIYPIRTHIIPADTNHPFDVYAANMGDPALIKRETEAVKKALEITSAKHMILMDSSFNYPIPTGPKKYYSEDCEATFTTLRDRSDVIVAHGKIEYARWGCSQSIMQAPVRVAQFLGVKHICLLATSRDEPHVFAESRDNRTVFIVRDHINFTGTNPLKGVDIPEFGVRFPDMGAIYTQWRREALRKKLRELGVTVREGFGMIIPEGGVSYSRASVRSWTSQFIGYGRVFGNGALLPLIAARHGGLECSALSIPEAIELASILEALYSILE